MELVRPFFSILIPMYNSSQYIDKCIDSILCQTVVSFEIILIDDGSIDDTVKTILKYKKLFPQIRLLQQNNKGVSAARNLGLENATGKYVIFMDSDDYWVNGAMSKLQEILLLNKNVDILFFNYLESYKASQTPHTVLSEFLGKKISQNKAIESVLSSKGDLGYCWNKVFNRESIRNARFDESINYSEDILFNVNCILHVEKIMSIEDCLYVYNLRAESTVRVFVPTQLIFFEVLDRIDQLISNRFHNILVIKKKFACIEFASRVIFTDHKMYRLLKKKCREEKIITNLNKYCLGKTEFITLLLANFSFTIAVLALRLIKKITIL